LAVAAIPAVRAVELRLGNAYPLTFTNVDQRQLSTSDGHLTIITVVTRKDEEKAQMVGERFSAHLSWQRQVSVDYGGKLSAKDLPAVSRDRRGDHPAPAGRGSEGDANNLVCQAS
jgi:hypothetical protein